MKAEWRARHGDHPRGNPVSAGAVEHGFTHFPLQQSVYVAAVTARTKAPAGMRWVAAAELHEEALPNVFRKVVVQAGLLAPSARR